MELLASSHLPLLNLTCIARKVKLAHREAKHRASHGPWSQQLAPARGGPAGRARDSSRKLARPETSHLTSHTRDTKKKKIVKNGNPGGEAINNPAPAPLRRTAQNAEAEARHHESPFDFFLRFAFAHQKIPAPAAATGERERERERGSVSGRAACFIS